MVNGLAKMSRSAIGRKGDGYIRACGDVPRDLGAVEAGASWMASTKKLKEITVRLPKVLRDILHSYHMRYQSDDILRKYVIPGVGLY
ncbi:hypothetical protein HK096_004927, partial [Nowakowskiella sp. JEL0078]